MSVINVNRETGNSFVDNDRYDDLDYTTGLREFKPYTPRLDFRSLAVLFLGSVIAFVVLFILYQLWKLIYCWNPIRYQTCNTINAAEPIVIGGTFLLLVVVVTWLVIARTQAWLRIQRGIANRTNLALDRWGSQTPADLFDKLTPTQILKYLETRYTEDSQLQSAIAQYQIYKGVNQLNEGSLHYHVENDPRIIDQPPEPPKALPTPTNGKSLLEYLVDAGHVDRSGKSLLLGYNAEKPIYIELAETGYIGIGGMPRVGKTTTAKSLIAQLGLLGAELVICDRHGYKKHGLINHLKPMEKCIQPAIDQVDITAAINYVYGVACDRLAEQVEKEYQPLVLVIDEFTGLILDEWLTESTLEKLASMALQAAKINVHGILIAHLWDNQTMGRKLGAKMRRCINQRVVHCCDPRDAELLLRTPDAKHVMGLTAGNAIYWGIGEQSVTVKVPELYDRDLEYVAKRSDLARKQQNQGFSSNSRSRSEIRSQIATVPAQAQSNGVPMHNGRGLAGGTAGGWQGVATPLHTLSREQRIHLARVLLRRGDPIRAVQSATHLDINLISKLYGEVNT